MPDAQEPTPSWYYGPDGAAQIFADPADVPKGWEDHPAKVAKKGKTAASDD